METLIAHLVIEDVVMLASLVFCSLFGFVSGWVLGR
jgi:hypothetical protein